MRVFEQEKLCHERAAQKQMLHNVRSKNAKKAFRKRMQGVSKRLVGELHHQQYSPYQFFKEQQKIHYNEYWDYVHIYAPSVLSLVKNQEEVIRFVNEIKYSFKQGRKVFVVLSRVEEITDDAIVVLLSYMILFKEKNIDFNGNYPKTKEAARKLKQSGFFDYLFKKGQEEYSVKKPNNTIYTHGNNRADSAFSGKLIETASKFVWGETRRCPGVQNTFTELMANTYKHASATEGEHHWWVSMTKDLEQKKVVFGFVDYGVGIFRSLSNKSPNDKMYKGLEKLWQKFPWANNNAKKMKLILEGELHKTVTLQSNRGRGLPYIHTCQENKTIDSLVIISNNVYADVKNGVYKLLDNEFIGTFVTWEMNSSIFSI